MLADRDVRVWLTGRLAVAGPAGRVDQASLSGRQARLALAYLVVHRTRPVPRDELAAALWPADPPPSLDVALNAVVSRLRTMLATVGLNRAETLRSAFGCYELRLPPAAWVDVEHAAVSLDHAEGALRARDTSRAWSLATVATAILRRPLLPGEDADWLRERRCELTSSLVRAYDCLSEAWLRAGDVVLGVRMAEEALRLAPFRERGHRRLMRAHTAAGDRAEALRAYQRCRVLLDEELGVCPAAETEAVYLAILRDEPAALA